MSVIVQIVLYFYVIETTCAMAATNAKRPGYICTISGDNQFVMQYIYGEVLISSTTWYVVSYMYIFVAMHNAYTCDNALSIVIIVFADLYIQRNVSCS